MSEVNIPPLPLLHILSGYDLEFAGMSTRERVRVMLEWFGRRQTIALPINSVVGCLIATILLMILSENNVRTLTPRSCCG